MRRALGFIFVTALLDSIGFGIILPVMPQLIMDVAGTDVTQAARWGGAVMMVYAAMQFVFAPVMGNLSDRFGRRPVLLISVCSARTPCSCSATSRCPRPGPTSSSRSSTGASARSAFRSVSSAC